MLFSLLVGAALIIGVMILGNWLMRSPPGSLKRRLGGGLIPLLLVIVAGLALTGRLGLALATLAAMAPWVMRGMQMWQAGRMIRDLFTRRRSDEGPGIPPAPPGARMSREEALRVLGLPEGSGEAEIHAAYRRLMSQLHPDKGGTDWMAAKLNEARDRLLGGK